MPHFVKCRWCKETFDRDDKSVDWIMPSKNWYYHKKCYDEKMAQKEAMFVNCTKEDNDVWFDNICQFLEKDLKVCIKYEVMRPMWDNLLKKGYKSKGVYFAIIYAYQIKKMDPHKSITSLGIVPYVYDEANRYFKEQSKINQNLYNDLIKQMQERAQRPGKAIKHKQNKNKKAKYQLEDLGGENEL